MSNERKGNKHSGAREEPEQATYKTNEISQGDVSELYDLGVRD